MAASERRRAAARPDCPRPGATIPDPGARRADREPRFREPIAGSRCGSQPCRDTLVERSAVDPSSGAGFRLRRPGRGAGGPELLRIGPPGEVVTAETLRACYAVEVAVLPVADSRSRVCVPRSYLS